MPPGGLHIRWPDAPLEQEARLQDYKWYAALAYVRANRLNHNVIEGAERPLRHHRQRQGLQRHAPGAGRPRHRRRHLPPPRHPPAQGQRGVAARGDGRARLRQGLQEILVVEEKRQVIEYQLKEELYNWRDDVRPRVLGKFDEPEGDWGRRVEPPNPGELAAARQGRPDAGDHRQGDRQALKKLGVDRRHRRAHGRARRHRGQGARRWRQAERQHRRAHPLVLLGLPAQHQHRVPEGSRALAGIGCHYMAVWMDRSTAPSPRWAARACPGSARRRSPTTHMFRQPGRRHLLPLGLLAIRAGGRRRRQHHLQDPLQRRGGDDRRPAGRRPALTRAADRSRELAPRA
jgi:indolepyruvate ferredoxin oxidoreductase